MPRRLTLALAVMACLVTILLVTLLAGVAIGWREARVAQVVVGYTVRPRPPTCPIRPLRLAVVGDLHVSPDVTPPALIAVMVARFDLAAGTYCVLLVGDYLGRDWFGDDWPHDRAAIDRALAPLTGLRPRVGSVAVLGNNDWEDGPDQIAASLTSVGIHVLRNDAWITPDAAFLGVEELSRTPPTRC